MPSTTDHFDEHHHPIKFITPTQIITAARCPRKYWYSSACRLEPAGGSHQAMIFGEAVHAALPYVVAERDIGKGFTAASEIWQGQIEDDKRNTTTLKMILVYLYEYTQPGRSLINLVKPPKSLATVNKRVNEYEIPFALSIPGLPVPIYGRIDGLGQHRDRGDFWGLEYKTCSEMSNRLLEGFDLYPQIITYWIALHLGMPELQIPGFYAQPILVAKTKQASELKQVIVHPHTAEAMLDQIVFLGNMILHYEKIKHFPQWFTGCTPYAQFAMPGFMCEYKNLCMMPDWTMTKDFYKVGKQHLPFEIPDNLKLEDVKPIEVNARDIPSEVTAIPEATLDKVIKHFS